MLIFIVLCAPMMTGSTVEYDHYYDYYSDEDQQEVETEVVLARSNVSLRCGGDDVGPSPRLFHNEAEVDLMSGRVLPTEHGFVIVSAKQTDSGRWACRRGDMKEQRKNLLVSDPGRLAVLLDTNLILNSSVIRLRRDIEVDITCSAVLEGDAVAALWWEGDHMSLTQNSDRSHQNGFTSVLIKVSSSLVLDSNISTLSCLTEDQRIDLEVVEEFRPEFTISRSPEFGVPILEEMMVILRCTVESSPSSQPVWEHNGVPLDSTVAGTNQALVTFEKISLSQDGWYQCTTQHKFGNFSSVGYYLGVKPKPRVTQVDSATTSSVLSDQVLLVESIPGTGCGADNKLTDFTLPKLFPQRKTVSAEEGESISVRIRFCSNPIPDTIIWSGSNLLLTPGTDSGRFTALPVSAVSDDCAESSLAIDNLTTEDSGLVVFIVRNSYHIVEAQVLLEVSTVDGQGPTAGVNLARISLTVMIVFQVLINV